MVKPALKRAKGKKGNADINNLELVQGAEKLLSVNRSGSVRVGFLSVASP